MSVDALKWQSIPCITFNALMAIYRYAALYKFLIRVLNTRSWIFEECRGGEGRVTKAREQVCRASGGDISD